MRHRNKAEDQKSHVLHAQEHQNAAAGCKEEIDAHRSEFASQAGPEGFRWWMWCSVARIDGKLST